MPPIVNTGRSPDGALHLCRELDEIPVGRVRRLDRHVDVVVAGCADVHVVDLAVRLEQAGRLNRVAGVEAAGDEVRERDPDSDHPVVPHPAAYLVDHLAREAEPVLERAAVPVGSLVVDGGEERVEEVAVRDVHLGAVEPTLP